MNTDKPSSIKSPFGSFPLRRYPARRGDSLLAWNASDRLLLEFAAGLGIPCAHTLVVNDEFGALAIPLGGECQVWTDSRLSEEAIRRNTKLNKMPIAPQIISMTESPGANMELVLLRIPKQMSLLRYQLQLLNATLPTGTLLVCGGMDKHLSTGVATLIESICGPTERHRGQRKARLFSSRTSEGTQKFEPVQESYVCEALGAPLVSLPNVFSASKLDIGTRLLLPQLKSLGLNDRVVDLCCGNGVIGLCAMGQRPELAVDFIDESSLALASARINVQQLFPDRLEQCSFTQSDGFHHYQGQAINHILCNPPFHQEHVVDDYSGRRLLKQSAGALQAGGDITFVANRHLPYQTTLQRHFNVVQLLDENSKFKVWHASRRCLPQL